MLLKVKTSGLWFWNQSSTVNAPVSRESDTAVIQCRSHSSASRVG